MPFSGIPKDEFVQFRPWFDCINNCSFCYLQHEPCRKTSEGEKKNRLKVIASFASGLDVNRIGLIGGDFFEGQLQGCEGEWFSMLDVLKCHAQHIFITANLIHEQYLLQETVELLDSQLMICTSYDEVGRFHAENQRKNWFDRIEDLHSQGVQLFCTCIATQDFFESKVEFPEWLGINLCDPQISTEWLISADKSKYNECLVKEQTYFNLPKRKTALRWFKQHPSVAVNYADFKAGHSNTVFGFNENEELVPELEERLQDDNFMCTECGHPYYAQCYADSPKCMACDAKRVAQQAELDSRGAGPTFVRSQEV